MLVRLVVFLFELSGCCFFLLACLLVIFYVHIDTELMMEACDFSCFVVDCACCSSCAAFSFTTAVPETTNVGANVAKITYCYYPRVTAMMLIDIDGNTDCHG